LEYCQDLQGELVEIGESSCILSSRLLEIFLNGKRKVNMELAKRLYKTLGVDLKFILEKS
jgi:hypothetical protein